MNSQAASTKFRSPWRVVLGSGLAQAVGAAPFILATFSLFMIPLAQETGWSHTAILAAFTSTSVGTAVGLPLVGRLLDKFAIRAIVVTSFILYSLSVAIIAVTPTILPLYYVPYFFVGFFASGTLLPFSKAVLSWFDNKRGMAIGATAALAGVGTTLTPLLASFLISTTGHRRAYAWMALIAVVIGLTLVLLFVRVRGERSVRGRLLSETVRNDQTVSLKLPGLSPRHALSDRHFWMILVSQCLAGIAVVGIQVNLVPIVTGRGLSQGQATVLLSIFGMASLLGRLSGFLLDRFHGPRVGAVVTLCPVVGVGLLYFDTPFAGAAFGAFLVGVAFGLEVDLLAFLTSRYLGMRRFGSLLGILQAAVLFSLAFGPLLVGIGFDLLGSYGAVIPYLTGALVLSALVLLFLGPYRYPAIHDFDRIAAQDELAAAEQLARLAQDEERIGDGAGALGGSRS